MNGEKLSGRSSGRLAFLAIVGLLASAQVTATQPPPSATGGKANISQMKAPSRSLPVRFEANRGQTDPAVKFFSRGTRESLFLTATEAVLAVPGEVGEEGPLSTETVRMSLDGGNAKAQVRGEDRLPGVSNYFLGSDPEKWVTEVPSYPRVRYIDAYPAIDVVYYGDEKGRLEYDFVVEPGGDPGLIRLSFKGHRGTDLDERGDLVLRTKSGEVRQHKPSIYQTIDGSRRRVDGRYVIEGTDTVRFALGAYDRALPLVIDPVITYSSYLGGSGIDAALGVAVDDSGSSYVTGSTTSIDFPLSAGTAPEGGKTCGSDSQCDAFSTPSTDPTKPAPYLPQPDAFVTKFDANGSLVFSTYLGHIGDDRGLGIAVDRQGQAYVTGRTNSPKFPTTANAFDKTCGTEGTCNYRTKDTDPRKGENRPDGFLAKLSVDGSTLLYSTFVGGSGDDTGRAGGIYYYTSATSTNPLDPDPGDEVEASRGTQGSGVLNGVHPGPAAAVAVGADGVAYMTGVTLSPDMRTTGGAFDQSCGTDGKCNKTKVEQGAGPTDDALLYAADSFLLKIDTTKPAAEAEQSLLYATYLGGSQSDIARGIGVAMIGNAPSSSEVLIAGAASPDFPQPGGAGGGFLLRLDTAAPPASAARYSRLFGSEVEIFGVASGPSGAAYLTGHTASKTFPVNGQGGAPPLQPQRSENPDTRATSYDRTTDAVVVKLDTAGSDDGPPIYSTYLGGWDNDSGRAISVDASGRASLTGYTASLNFPTKEPIQTALEREELTVACKQFTAASPAGPGGPDCRDAFLAVVEADGTALTHSTYLRGKELNPDGSREDGGSAVASWTEPGSGVGHTIVVGRTGTNDFPTVGAHQPEPAGYFDGFVTKISLVPPATPRIRSVTPGTGNSAGGTEVVIEGTRLGAATATVNFGDTPAKVIEASADGSRIRALTPPGTGRVQVTVTTTAGASPQSSFARFGYFDGTWTKSKDNATKRNGHTATVLDGPNCEPRCGKVLLVGGSQDPTTTSTSAELYDPASGESESAGCVPAAGVTCPVRGVAHTATLLSDGTVLIVGGANSPSTAQLYKPQSGAWENVGNPVRPRAGHTATLLSGTQAQCGENCGKVLVASGGALDTSRSAELYDPIKKTWALTGALVDSRNGLFTATLITGPRCAANCGKVLVSGGLFNDPQSGTQSSSSAELYDPKSGRWTSPTERRTDLISRFGHTSTMLPTGMVLIAGGAVGPAGGGSSGTTAQATASAELYDPAKPFNEAFSVVRTQMLTARSGHTAVALGDGRVLITGGSGVRIEASEVRQPLASAEIFDPAARGGEGGWTPAGSMAVARGFGPFPGGHTLSLVRHCGGTCEKALVVGGGTNGNAQFNGSGGWGPGVPSLASVELYTPGPHISAITPGTGAPAGGEEVVIFGSGFVAELMPEAEAPITFGGVPARRFTVESPTRITAVTPPAAKDSIVEVAAVVKGLGRATSSFSYTESAGAVGDLLATPLSGNEVRLGFTAPGFPPSGEYVVKQSRTPISEASFEAAQPVCSDGVCRFTVNGYQEKLTVSVGGLTPETTYYYALKVKNSDGLGPISNVAMATTSNVVPGSVSDLVATALNDREARLTFSAPGSNGTNGPPATRYIVKQSKAPIVDGESFEKGTALCEGGVCILQPGTVGEGLSLTIGGLERDSTYHYALRALDEAGNVGPISNSASVAPGCVAPTAGPGQVLYGGGYRLIGLPEGTRVPAQSVLYGWFNLGRGGRYSAQEADQPVAGGRGYWAWFSCPRLVTLGSGTASASSTLERFRASMVGNPSGSGPSVLSGHDFTARWDPNASGGRGGYQISGYRQNQTLEVGEGVWAFSYQDTTLSLRAP